MKIFSDLSYAFLTMVFFLLYHKNRTEKEDEFMDAQTRARELFLSGYNCAQSVAGAFAEKMGLPLETVLKTASSFGGGMGGLRETCGAVTGMFLVAGYLYGYSDPEDLTQKTAHYASIRKLAVEFTAEHDTTVCRELLRDLPGKLKQDPSARTEEYYKVRPCVRFVESGARILERWIREREGEKHIEDRSTV